MTRARYRPWSSDGPVADDHRRFLADLADPDELSRRARARFGSGIGSRDSGERIAAFVVSHADRGEPASLVRLGDGEGNLMALALGDYPALADYCAYNRSVKHFGNATVLSGHADTLLPAFSQALRSADVIGIHPPSVPHQSLARPVNANQVSAVVGVLSTYRYLDRFHDEVALDRTTGTVARFHRTLLPHYGEIVGGRRIGLVACHPQLPDALRAELGARSVDFHPLPEQAKVRPGPPSDTHHFPERFEQLLVELTRIEPGRVYLVAAGILAKIYCDVIRSAGGIALDIGSVADLWVGVVSRAGVGAGAIDAWRLT